MTLLTDSVHAWRHADGTHYLAWDVADPETRVDVRVLTAGEPVAIERDAATEAGAHVRIEGLCPLTRHRFRLADDRGNAINLAARGVGLEGAGNFRDFGGYRTQSGRSVGWGHLYRSGNLSRLSGADLEQLARLNIELICDFRREDEQSRDPTRLPGLDRQPRILSLPVTPGSQASALYGDTATLDGREAMFSFMVDINREFVHSQSDRFAEMFSAILDLRPQGLVVHCAAGKDRTGFGAGLVLAALGVPEELILRDYLLTRHYFDPWRELPRVRAKYPVSHLDDEALLPMLSVDEAYLGAAFAAIVEVYGSIDRYLTIRMGVGDAERRALAGLYLTD